MVLKYINIQQNKMSVIRIGTIAKSLLCNKIFVYKKSTFCKIFYNVLCILQKILYFPYNIHLIFEKALALWHSHVIMIQSLIFRKLTIDSLYLADEGKLLIFFHWHVHWHLRTLLPEAGISGKDK